MSSPHLKVPGKVAATYACLWMGGAGPLVHPFRAVSQDTAWSLGPHIGEGVCPEVYKWTVPQLFESGRSLFWVGPFRADKTGS